MLALPGYSNAEFDETLSLLAEGGCTHISAYLLKIEPGTAFAARRPEGLPDADAAAEFYLYAVEKLAQAGYRQYEISNFAKPGHEGRHNLLYWNCRDYWGVGPAAHSCLNGVRRFWPGDTEGFIAGTLREQEEGVCDAEDFLLMQLRLTKGLRIDEYAAHGGEPFTPAQQAFFAPVRSARLRRMGRRDPAPDPGRDGSAERDSGRIDLISLELRVKS